MGVEKLQQQGKPLPRVVSAEQFLTPPADQFAQGDAGQGSRRDDALVVPMVADLPALGVVALRADRLAQQVAEAAPPPDVLTKERAEV